MEITTVTYEACRRDACVRIMGDTWDFDRLFPGIGKPGVVNEIFFREATSMANYSELLVDDRGEVQGYLFGKIPRAPGKEIASFVRTVAAALWGLAKWAAGAFGPRLGALSRFSELLAMSRSLDSLRRKDDAYVSLFFVRKTARGLGLGKRLMDRFMEVARGYDCARVYLWTDKGCNFGFYDRCGFSRIGEVRSPLLAQPGPEPNGFIYAKELR